jgi:hypothetical protein
MVVIFVNESRLMSAAIGSGKNRFDATFFVSLYKDRFAALSARRANDAFFFERVGLQNVSAVGASNRRKRHTNFFVF